MSNKTAVPEFKGISVEVHDNNIEDAIRRFKKKVKNSNLSLEIKKHRYYKKPSQRKREERWKAELRYKYGDKEHQNRRNNRR